MRASKTMVMAGALSATMLLAGCGGRDARPVAVAQPTDSMLSCPLLMAEISGNNSRAVSLLDEKKDAENSNVAIGVAGALLFWPALFFMDLSDTEEIEMRALRDRNNYLAQLALAQDCGPVPAASPQDAAEDAILERTAAAQASGRMPNCSEVGGYEEYMRRTNEACRLDH